MTWILFTLFFCSPSCRLFTSISTLDLKNEYWLIFFFSETALFSHPPPTFPPLYDALDGNRNEQQASKERLSRGPSLQQQQHEIMSTSAFDSSTASFFATPLCSSQQSNIFHPHLFSQVCHHRSLSLSLFKFISLQKNHYFIPRIRTWSLSIYSGSESRFHLFGRRRDSLGYGLIFGCAAEATQALSDAVAASSLVTAPR